MNALLRAATGLTSLVLEDLQQVSTGLGVGPADGLAARGQAWTGGGAAACDAHHGRYVVKGLPPLPVMVFRLYGVRLLLGRLGPWSW